MRTLSLTFRTSHEQEMDDEIDVLLLTFTHPLFAEPQRLSSDPTSRLSTEPLRYGTLSRGNTYDFLPFGWVPPADGEEAAPTFELSIANFSPDLIAMLRMSSVPALVKAEIVQASTPDIVEIDFPEFDLVNASYNDEEVRISLVIDSMVNQPVPSGTFTPASFPGLF